jgi:hypothetical protein
VMMGRAGLLTMICFLLAMIVPAARAQEGGEDAEVTKMAKEHYRAGLEAYKAGQYDVAIKELKRAYLLKRLPPLLLNIGATYRKMGDLDLALHFYKKYLDEAPPEAKDRPDVEATIQQIEQEKAAGGSKPVEPPPSEGTKEEPPPPKKPPMPTEWKHTVVDAAPPGTPLDVRVSMPIMKGVKVYVFYRAAGESDFQQVLMKRHGAEKVGRIPGDAMQGNAMQYYIEARDPQGQVVQSSGSQSSPNIVMIDPNAPPQMVASLDTSHERGEQAAPEPAEVTPKHDRDEEEAPLLVESKKQKKERRGGGGGGGGAHTLRWAGVGLLAGGVALGAVGGAMLGLAKQQSDAVAADSAAVDRSMGCPDPMGCVSFLYNDPTVHGSGGDDASFQQKGKLYDTLGITFTTIGAAAGVAGIALIVVDTMRGGSGSERAKPAKRRPRTEEESSWYVAPSFGAAQAGVSGGFSF